MSTRMRTIASLALSSCLLVGCQSLTPEPPTDFEALQDASDAALAYERGDCETVSRLASPRELERWEASEVRHSTMLLDGFCKELAGEIDAAREIYELLIEEAPTSFAARDALERARIIRINESDPNHAAWIREARDRAIAGRGTEMTRVPIERQAANFPPIARTAGVEGYAVVEFGVTPRGTTSDPIVIDSKPPLLFDGAAVRAIRRWEFESRRSASANDYQIIRLLFLTEDPTTGPTEIEPVPVEQEADPQM